MSSMKVVTRSPSRQLPSFASLANCTQDPARPSSQHRPSVSSAGPRPSVSRPHSHSVSLGSLNANNRVNRRKSSTSMTGLNRAALAAAIREGSQGGIVDGRPDLGDGLGISNGYRNSLPAPSPDMRPQTSASRKSGSALVDGPPLQSKGSTKARGRRASEGSVLKKERRNTGAGELKCETCGKGYKHGSCLQKHLSVLFQAPTPRLLTLTV